MLRHREDEFATRKNFLVAQRRPCQRPAIQHDRLHILILRRDVLRNDGTLPIPLFPVERADFISALPARRPQRFKPVERLSYRLRLRRASHRPFNRDAAFRGYQLAAQRHEER